jgi:cystathionine beta-lyase/cystathionine gamma-synthase
VEEIERFCDGLKHFKMAVSWGGHESLIIPKISVMPRNAFYPEKKDHRMIRIYVGLEDAEYLIQDLASL